MSTIFSSTWMRDRATPCQDIIIKCHPETTNVQIQLGAQRKTSPSKLTQIFLRCRYFTGMSICDKLVVHPSYRRRGHATSMLQWGQRLSVMDAVDRGVMPSHLGEPIYKALGYEFIGEVHIPNDGEVEGFSQRVLVYRGKR